MVSSDPSSGCNVPNLTIRKPLTSAGRIMTGRTDARKTGHVAVTLDSPLFRPNEP
jgi:hypothetical protein